MEATSPGIQTGTTQPRDRQPALPIKADLSAVYSGSLLIALLVAVVSGAGLGYRTLVYPTDALRQAFVANDVVNVCIGMPVLLVTMALTRRGKLIGLLCWPGAQFFVLYTYLAYVFAMPFGWAFLGHLALVMLSAYSLVGLLAAIDANAVQQRLRGTVRERLAAGVLAGLGLAFLLRVMGVMVTALASGVRLAETELAGSVSDFLTTPAWVIGGLLLWRRKAFGYVVGLGLLFQGSMLFVALIIFLLLQPMLTAAPLAVADVAVIAAMGLICFIPFGLFLRGVNEKGRP